MRTESASEPSATLTLRDGRRLSYAVFGDPAGTPVFLLHGNPGSRFDRHPDESIADALHARLILPERPGYGNSAFQPRRRLLDWPDDVAQLADHLNIQRFAVIGHSAGGAYAMACAVTMPDRLTAVALVSSVGPYSIPGAMKGMAATNRVASRVARYAPWFLHRRIYDREARGVQRSGDSFGDAFEQMLAEPDRSLARRPDVKAMILRSVTESFRSGGSAWAWDDRLLAHYWGFQMSEITLPVALWYGGRDTLVPPAVGKWLASAIPACQATYLPNEGHLTLYLNHWRDILSYVLA